MAATRDQSVLRQKMEQLDAARTEVKGQLDRERLAAVTSNVIETITSPEFIEKMRAAREKASDSDGMTVVSKLLSLDGLRRAGAEIPDDFRLTSRMFEDKASGTRIVVDNEIRKPAGATLGWGACAGAGGLTFCGCGGFSTD